MKKLQIKQIPHSKPWITKEDENVIQQVMSNRMISRGVLVKSFEERVAEYNNCIGAFSFSNATFAIIFALKALGIGEGKEVIIPTYVCRSVLDAVRFTGAKAVLCDTGVDTWNITPETVKSCLTKATAAIIAVHIFGILADIQGLKEFNIPIIEDCAQAFGTECNGNKPGLIGDIGVYSFHATKCLTTGEGGMVAAKDGGVFERLMRGKKEMSSVISPMSDLQASLGLNQLSRYDKFLERRQKIAGFYFKNLPETWTSKLMELEKGNIFFRFLLYGDFDFEHIRKEAEKSGIHIRRGVDTLLHDILNLNSRKFLNAETFFKRTLSIPIYPSLTTAECKVVVDVLKNIIP